MSNIRTAQAAKQHNVLLPMISIVALAVAWAYWQIVGFDFTSNDDAPLQIYAEDIPRNDVNIKKRLNIHGISLGMTPRMLIGLYPQASGAIQDAQADVINFDTELGRFVLWTHEENKARLIDQQYFIKKTKRIWRMRLDEVYPLAGSEVVLARYGRWYGKPLEANCTRSAPVTAPVCKYLWLGGDGIRLEAVSRTKVDSNAKQYMVFTTTATDTYIEALRQDQSKRKLLTRKMTSAPLVLAKAITAD